MSTLSVRIGTTAALLFVTAGLGRFAVAQPAPSASFIVTNVRVFDGERMLVDASVMVEEGIIRAVGPRRTEWRELPVVDGGGGTLIPGLIDAHAHVSDVEQLRQALRFGVTTVLDMGATRIPQDQVFAVRSIAQVATDMADLRSAGFLASARRPAGSLRPIISTVEDATSFVAQRYEDGSNYLKLQLNAAQSEVSGDPSMNGAMANALVTGAHAKGMLAIAHVETLEDVEVALSAGVDGLAHVWRKGGANSQLAGQVARDGVFVIATLVIPDGFLDGRARLLADARFQSVLSDALREHLNRPFSSVIVGDSPDQLRDYFEAHVDGVRSLVEAGATLLVGTDSATTTPAAHGISVHRELELLTFAGLSPLEALRAATSSAADAFRLTDRGRITPGLRADMILIRGDPSSDITATRDILRVWRSGVEFDRTVVD